VSGCNDITRRRIRKTGFAIIDIKFRMEQLGIAMDLWKYGYIIV